MQHKRTNRGTRPRSPADRESDRGHRDAARTSRPANAPAGRPRALVRAHAGGRRVARRALKRRPPLALRPRRRVGAASARSPLGMARSAPRLSMPRGAAGTRAGTPSISALPRGTPRGCRARPRTSGSDRGAAPTSAPAGAPTVVDLSAIAPELVLGVRTTGVGPSRAYESQRTRLYPLHQTVGRS